MRRTKRRYSDGLRKLLFEYKMLGLVLPTSCKLMSRLLTSINVYISSIVVNMVYDIIQYTILNLSTSNTSIIDSIDTTNNNGFNLQLTIRSQMYVAARSLESMREFRLIKNALSYIKRKAFRHNDNQMFIDYTATSIIHEYKAVMKRLDVTPAIFNELITKDKVSFDDVTKVLTSASQYAVIYAYPNAFMPLIDRTIRLLVMNLVNHKHINLADFIPNIDEELTNAVSKQFAIGVICDLIRLSILWCQDM